MTRRFKWHLRKNLIAYLALFFAMSGTAYAAATIGSAHVIDESLLSRDLKNNAAVNGSDVVNNGLTGADVNEGTLGQVPRASYSSYAGGAGVFYWGQSVSEPEPMGANSGGHAHAECPPGTTATGGGHIVGYDFDPSLGEYSADPDIMIDGSFASEAGGWVASATNATSRTDAFVMAVAECVYTDLNSASAASAADRRSSSSDGDKVPTPRK